MHVLDVVEIVGALTVLVAFAAAQAGRLRQRTVTYQLLNLIGSGVLATIAMVHVERPRTALINMFALSTGIAACLALLMVHDRPFSTGGFTLEPAALREIAVGE